MRYKWMKALATVTGVRIPHAGRQGLNARADLFTGALGPCREGSEEGPEWVRRPRYRAIWAYCGPNWRAVRIAVTTSWMARIDILASSSHTTSELWLAPSARRISLLEESEARSSWSASQPGWAPRPAETTMRGRPPSDPDASACLMTVGTIAHSSRRLQARAAVAQNACSSPRARGGRSSKAPWYPSRPTPRLRRPPRRFRHCPASRGPRRPRARRRLPEPPPTTVAGPSTVPSQEQEGPNPQRVLQARMSVRRGLPA